MEHEIVKSRQRFPFLFVLQRFFSEFWCDFAKNVPDCDQDEGFFDYISGAFCGFPVGEDESWIIGVYIIYFIWLLYLFALLATITDDYFVPVRDSRTFRSVREFKKTFRPENSKILLVLVCESLFPALNWIAATLNLNENIAGITFVALGNGAADIFGAMAALTSATAETSSLAIGALLGAGAFIRLVVAGACIWICPVKIPDKETLRDVIFSIGAIYWLFLCIWKEEIGLIDSIGFLVLYAFYIVVVVIMSFFFKEKRTRRDTWTIEDGDDQQPIDIEQSNTAGTSAQDDNDSDQSALEDFGVTDDSITTRDIDPIISEEIEFKSVKNELIAALTVFSRAEWKAMNIKDKESFISFWQ